MKKLVGLTMCAAIAGSSLYYQSHSAGAETVAVAPCADHNSDASKRYLGGRMINHETRQPMKDVRVILISLAWSWRDEFNEDYPLPKPIEYETFTNERGEFWFAGWLRKTT